MTDFVIISICMLIIHISISVPIGGNIHSLRDRIRSLLYVDLIRQARGWSHPDSPWDVNATYDPITPNDASTESNHLTTPTNENVNVGKLISESNNRMATAARINQNQTQSNNTQINNIRASIIRNSTTNTPGETTDF